MLIVFVAAGATWLNVVRTIRSPDPLAIPERPPIAGIVWSNRVFIHERALKRWLETRGHSYAVWAREHPRAVAVLRDRPQSRQRAVASRKPQGAAGAAQVASDDIGLAAFALLVAGLLGATALFLVAARRAVVVALDRSSRLPRIDARPVRRLLREAWEGLARTSRLFVGAFVGAMALMLIAARGAVGVVGDGASRLPRLDTRPLGPRSRAAWEGLARTAQRAVSAARAGVQALFKRLAERWTDGLPSVHRRPSAAEALPPVRRSPELRGPNVRIRVSAWWADVAPGYRVRERFGDAPVADSMRRLYDTFLDAFEALSDYRFRIALWMLTAVIAAAGMTFLIAQSTQP